MTENTFPQYTIPQPPLLAAYYDQYCIYTMLQEVNKNMMIKQLNGLFIEQAIMDINLPIEILYLINNMLQSVDE